MAQILDDIDELEREINRVKDDPFGAHAQDVLAVCKRTLQLVRRVAERQERPR